MSDGGVRVQVLENFCHTNLRGAAHDNNFLKRAESHLGQAIPLEPNCFTEGRHRIYWLGPDEWLVASTPGDEPNFASRLQEHLTGLHVSVNDQSGGQITLRITGSDVPGLLAKGCTLDFHHDVFASGKCAQSGLAKANVLIACLQAGSSYDVIVRRSFSDYLLRWLRAAARHDGIEFH